MRKKIFFDLRLLIIAIPLMWYSIKYMPQKNDSISIHPFLSGIAFTLSVSILFYIIISWIFYNELKKLIK